MAQIPSSPLPPASAEYETAMHSVAGKLPLVHKWKMFRSSQNETHLDFGKTGLISKPGASQAILLDHVKKEARIVPAPPQAPPPAHAQAPAGSAAPLPTQPPGSSLLHVKDLGKQTIEGHEAEGKMYTFQPPKLPTVPSVKGLPGLKPPKPAGSPQPPGPPQPPSPGKPSAPAVTPPHGQVQTLEVWMHTKLHVPVLTKAGGNPGSRAAYARMPRAANRPLRYFKFHQDIS